MIIKAEQKHIRISPRKVRNVVSGIKHLSPQKALIQLKFSHAKPAEVVAKVIKQALANASHNQNLNSEQLIFDQLQVNEGPTFKRWQPVSRGRAHAILKRTSHIRITLKNISTQTTTTSTAPTKPPKPSVKKTTPKTKKAKNKINNPHPTRE